MQKLETVSMQPARGYVGTAAGPADAPFRVKRASEAEFLEADIYSTALKFIRGDIDIDGDVRAAIRYKLAHPGTRFRQLRTSALGALASLGVEHWFQTRRRAAQNITFHYDRSNDFYAAFLDRKMVYSCAYFARPDMTLDEAQAAKLDHICRKLAVSAHDSFFDVGCGWGAMVMHAAREYGAQAAGCTVSPQQAGYGRAAISKAGLDGMARVDLCDYRDVQGQFAKIASVGMFEHVGRKRLPAYFQTIYAMLERDGLFLNHGIVNAAGTKEGPQTRFLREYVFPGSELARLGDVIDAAEMAGFEVLDIENLRPHYALTCEHWARRLQQNRERCLQFVTEENWRIWLLYLAGCSISFEDGGMNLCQILLAKRGSRKRPLTRAYMYA